MHAGKVFGDGGPRTRRAAVAAACVLIAAVAMAAWTWRGGGAAPAATPSSPTLSLAGTTWRAITIDGRAVVAGNAGVGPILEFPDGATFKAADPCNVGTGSYRLSGDHLTFGDFAMTEMACGSPELLRQQQRFADILRETRTVRRDGENLSLLADSGTVLVVFVGPPGSAPTDATEVQVRIRNDAATRFDKVEVNFYDGPVVDYGSLEPGASSDYRTPRTRAYSYAWTRVTMGSSELVFLPTDAVGERPLTPGRYTYALRVKDGALELSLER